MFRFLHILLLALGSSASSGRAEYMEVQVPIGHNKSKATLQLYLFDSRRESIVVIDQESPALQAYRDLGAAMRAHQCLAGCNGAPFNQPGTPRGLVIAGQKSFGDPTAPQAGEGVIYVEGGTLRLTTSRQFLARKGKPPNHLLQSGPFLVSNGKTTPNLDRHHISRRTFLLTDGKHRWGIGVAPATTQASLARALAGPGTFQDFAVATALSLDGGLSSGFWIQRNNGPLYLKESRRVRNFLGIVKR
jgi:uncharacterized protein YigE (DUF2233 family)